MKHSITKTNRGLWTAHFQEMNYSIPKRKLSTMDFYKYEAFNYQNQPWSVDRGLSKNELFHYQTQTMDYGLKNCPPL